MGEEGVWDSDVALSAGVLNWPLSRDKRPQMQAPVSFLDLACTVLRTSQEWKFPTKYLFMEKILSKVLCVFISYLHSWELRATALHWSRSTLQDETLKDSR